jgi:hypothetical protein
MMLPARTVAMPGLPRRSDPPPPEKYDRQNALTANSAQALLLP